MPTKSTTFLFTIITACASAADAQDFNYVPGWSNTTNHAYKGKSSGGEWSAKKELFDKLGAQGAEAKCTLKNLSEADGNVITNQYRSDVRKSNENSALRNAQRKVAAHHKTMKAQGKC